MTVRIATRRSALAKWQAHHVSDLLRAREPGLDVQLLELMTRGDRILDVPLAEVGGKGLFVKEIEDALLRRDAQIAVHSMKDLPAVEPPGLVIAAVPVREDPRDALCSHGKKLSELPKGAKVGTASLRRAAQLMALRPDLQIETIRGNVATRLRKIDEGFDAVVLAYAGLRRLGLADKVVQVFGTDEMLPAVAQGALAIEAREDDAETLRRLAPLEDRPTRIQVEAERGFLRRLQGGCQVPIAGHAEVRGEAVRLRGLVANLDGTVIIRGERTGAVSEAAAVGEGLAEELLARGAGEILARIEKGPGLTAPKR
ncbi:MAG TPA: hydroxymethylbilane synthase [Anaeromyxobacteraceae bacterium]|nr:hydroxymethylbilane synthase [Anaeromyxobacteraceae bacterium]